MVVWSESMHPENLIHSLSFNYLLHTKKTFFFLSFSQDQSYKPQTYISNYWLLSSTWCLTVISNSISKMEFLHMQPDSSQYSLSKQTASLPTRCRHQNPGSYRESFLSLLCPSASTQFSSFHLPSKTGFCQKSFLRQGD